MNDFKLWLIHESEDFQFILYFGLLCTMIIVETFAYFRKVKKGRRWLANFILTLISIFFMTILPVTLISAAHYAELHKIGLFYQFQLHIYLTGSLTLLLRGFISFFTHYLAHKIPLFWRFHRVHHLDQEMDVTTTVRFHPIEFIINSIIGVPIILLFGFPVWALMLYELFDIIITLISHANISFPKVIERYIRYVFVTPNLHRIHHSSYQPETDSNFSAVFPIWDIIFGTFKSSTLKPQKEMDLGLEEIRDQRSDNWWWLILSPFEKFK